MSTPVGSAATAERNLAFAVVGLELQLSPARQDSGGLSNYVAYPLGRVQRLFRGLTIDEQDASKGEDEIGTLLEVHTTSS